MEVIDADPFSVIVLVLPFTAVSMSAVSVAVIETIWLPEIVKL